ncbi:hypothetical protein [Collimonas arenae]|uniref:hypothetical protein n=1 Tax=Collimonas arenae TaxID=279058 RepID=UPI00056DA7D9|nr:hypothetical protein [Collimonas arenae]
MSESLHSRNANGDYQRQRDSDLSAEYWNTDCGEFVIPKSSLKGSRRAQAFDAVRAAMHQIKQKFPAAGQKVKSL